MKNKGNQSTTEDLPTVREVLDKMMTRGTALLYQEEPIIFNNKFSPVKSLQVQICSIEGDNQAILHKLHTLTRTG
ncbi:hypothetical protein A2228_03305 [Candidatus Collierbacteria bacterium RIFOXYA2_FULL_46_10]|uniref:Uncharacterized protein n=1 Tax=Candidatus Collierbacteria bacterium RIFOXYA2_FULL_46_10 TaxID=1817726 RepID=A0A1F5F5D3_9BACT|nr:MAG: hypothetical protein A2228_03305 [Candidatus Collierbacteria bacterium RIFOXYA2_FULL_46_10]